MGKIADVSKYQGNVDWEKARKELDFVIFRASCGLGEDGRYVENTSKCELPYGAYHYVIAGTAARAREEARYFVEETRKAKRRPNFYIADIEHENQTETTTEPVCVAFLNELRKLGCKKVGLYINRKYKYAGKAIEMCDIMWIPHWGANNGEVPGDESKPPYPHDLWQYTSHGRVEGIDGNVDLSQMTGTKPLEYFTEECGELKLGDRVLKAGDEGSDVKELQEKLVEMGFKLPKYGVDAEFGDETEKALKAWQKRSGLEESGKFSEADYKALCQSDEKPEKGGLFQAIIELLLTLARFIQNALRKER